MSRHFLDDLSNYAAHGIYQRDLLYDILSVTPLLFRDDQAGLLQAVILVQAKQNLVWLMSIESLSKRRFCQHGRQPEVNRVVIDGE